MANLMICNECGRSVDIGDIARAIVSDASHGKKSEYICVDCDHLYQDTCDHKKTSIIRLPVCDEDEGTVECCAECEGIRNG